MEKVKEPEMLIKREGQYEGKVKGLSMSRDLGESTINGLQVLLSQYNNLSVQE